ncbi:UNVERIFIED_CONTAM: hypothetical protein Sradi_4581700 [Sesamum radiatum]|uniref:Uncharacterized protein n=1 Tax=Sesamum radiatum TaxID=300843 RepID=A0AAW2NA97_SESRA
MSLASNGSRSSTDDSNECEASKTAIALYQAREEEIERRKMEVRERLSLSSPVPKKKPDGWHKSGR